MQQQQTAIVGTIDWLGDRAVTFKRLPVVNGGIFDGDETVSLAVLEQDGWADTVVAIDEDDTPDLRAELEGVLKRRFEFLK